MRPPTNIVSTESTDASRENSDKTTDIAEHVNMPEAKLKYPSRKRRHPQRFGYSSQLI